MVTWSPRGPRIFTSSNAAIARYPKRAGPPVLQHLWAMDYGSKGTKKGLTLISSRGFKRACLHIPLPRCLQRRVQIAKEQNQLAPSLVCVLTGLVGFAQALDGNHVLCPGVCSLKGVQALVELTGLTGAFSKIYL